MERTLTLQKVKKDAEQQKALMRRKAMINKRNEDERDGLVIVNAKYGLLPQVIKSNEDGNGDSQEENGVIDVAVQLQFWVNDSKLVLTSNSKSQMLGFYDVRLNANTLSQSPPTMENKDGSQTRRSHGIASLWRRLFTSVDENVKDVSDVNVASPSIPCLMIRYKFNGMLYDTQIMDDEAITLPSPRAVKVVMLNK